MSLKLLESIVTSEVTREQ